jgi:hypothetical protein
MLNLSVLSDSDREVQLREAWTNRETLWDLCNPHHPQGLALYVKSCGGKLVLSKFPNQGPLHDFVCRHYSFAAADLRDRGWSKGVVVRTRGEVLLIRPAFSVFNVTGIAAQEDGRTWGSGERVKDQPLARSATLGGLTCLMIEMARLDIYELATEHPFQARTYVEVQLWFCPRHASMPLLRSNFRCGCS